MYERISELVKHLESDRRASILLVGDYMLDEYLVGDIERISPEAPVPVMRVVSRTHRLGGAGSVAASMLGLEAKTYCLGVVGNDKAGTAISRLLKDADADITGLIINEHITTTVKQRMIGMAQHRIRQQLLRVDTEDAQCYPAELIDKLRQIVSKLIDKVQLIALEDYNKGIFSDNGFSQWIISQANQRKISVVVDPASISDFSRYAGATLITPNRIEASKASGINIRTIDDAKQSADILIRNFNVKSVAITLDRDGILVSDGKSYTHIPDSAA